VLAHKPAQLGAVAAEIAGVAKAVVSILARTTQADLRDAYPGTPVFRIEPNTPVEVKRGVLAFAIPDAPVDADLLAEVRERFSRLGTVVDVPEPLMRVAGATGGVGPAYFALVAEAWVDAGIRHGLPPRVASALVTETMAGSAELLRAREHDTLALRRAVASPGGTTARGLAALERGGVRAAFGQAMDDVVGT
jgi:pyrroline-5-carboxylate reductase